MRILMMNDSLVKGGRERRMLELIKGLLRDLKGAEIHIVLLTDVVEYHYVYDLPVKLTIIKRKHKRDFSAFRPIRMILKQFNPDIVHAWGTMSSMYLSALRLWQRFIFVNSSIANAYPGMNLFNKLYFRVKVSALFSDCMIANSQAGIKAYNIRPGKAICIYNVIDLSRFKQLDSPVNVALDVLGREKRDSFIAVMVAAFEKRKDYPTLIDAATSSCRKWTDIFFLLIGEGSQLEEMRAKVPADLLDKRICFLGNRNNIEAILQIADVGLLITPSEGLSNSIIEYMASGKPVIASRGGGVEELVKDQWNGLVVEQARPDQIEQALDKLRSDPALRVYMGNNGKKWVEDNLASNKITQTYIDVYQQLLNKKRR